MNPTTKCVNHLLEHDAVFRDNWTALERQAMASPKERRNVETALIKRGCMRLNIHVRDFAEHTSPALPNPVL